MDLKFCIFALFASSFKPILPAKCMIRCVTAAIMPKTCEFAAPATTPGPQCSVEKFVSKEGISPSSAKLSQLSGFLISRRRRRDLSKVP